MKDCTCSSTRRRKNLCRGIFSFFFFFFLVFNSSRRISYNSFRYLLVSFGYHNYVCLFLFCTLTCLLESISNLSLHHSQRMYMDHRLYNYCYLYIQLVANLLQCDSKFRVGLVDLTTLCHVKCSESASSSSNNLNITIIASRE
jgi:hypothetical protein